MAAKKKPIWRPITGSVVERVMRCAASAVMAGVFGESGEDAERGTIIHTFLDEAKRLGRDKALARVREDLRSFCALIDLDEYWGAFDGAEVATEVAIVYNVLEDTARIIDAPGRRYGKLEPHEIAMTLDAVGVRGTEATILDAKSGREVTAAEDNWQLKIQSLGVSRALRITDITAGIAYLDENAKWEFDFATFDSMDLEGFAEDVRSMLLRVEDAGALHVKGVTLDVFPSDSACKWCPAILGCPSKVSMVRELVAVGTPVVDLAVMTPAQLGDARTQVMAYLNVLEAIKKGIDDVARSGIPLPLPDGKVLRPCDEERESFDGDLAYGVLFDSFGEVIADACVEKKITKASMRRGLEAGADAAINALRNAGAAKVKRLTVLRSCKS